MADFFNTYFSAPSRIGGLSRINQSDHKNPLVYEGYVVSYGTLEIFSRTAIVFIPQLKNHLRATIAMQPLSFNGIGESTHLNYGDRVYIRFLRGNSNIPEIIGRVSSVAGLLEGIAKSTAKSIKDISIPQPFQRVRGIPINPPPEALVPEALDFGGKLDIKVSTLENISSGNNSPHSAAPGNITFTTPTGDVVYKLAGSETKFATSFTQSVTANPTPGDTTEIKQVTQRFDVLRGQLQNYDLNLSIGTQLTPITDFSPNYVTGNEEFGAASKTLTEELIVLATEKLSQAEAKVKSNIKQNKCIEKTISSQSKASLGQSILSNVTRAAVDEALGFVNSKLPSFMQVGADVKTDETGNTSVSVTGLKVGGVSYNPENQKITVEGNVFDPLINGGLDVLNKNLPDYAKVSLDEFGIRTQTVSVPFSKLFQAPDNTAEVGDTASAKVDEDGRIIYKVAGQEYEIGRVLKNKGSDVITSVATQGLGSLNKNLPDFLQVGSTLKYNKETDKVEGGVSLGPIDVSQDEKGKLNLAADPAKIGDTVDNLVSENVINQLPAPLGVLARAAWESIDFTDVFSNLLGIKKPTDLLGGNTSNNQREGACKPTQPAIPPMTIMSGSQSNTVNAGSIIGSASAVYSQSPNLNPGSIGGSPNAAYNSSSNNIPGDVKVPDPTFKLD